MDADADNMNAQTGSGGHEAAIFDASNNRKYTAHRAPAATVAVDAPAVTTAATKMVRAALVSA
jgi:hypothetical protein